jgi:holin-like protein
MQIGILFGICLLGETISAFLPFPLPGTILSMVILFLMLIFRIIKIEHIREKADFLLKNMAFFLIPAGVGILSVIDTIQNSIFPILFIVFVTTILTFGATVWTVRGVMALQDIFRRSRQKGAVDNE